jgi:hypothetical protein
MKRGLVSAEATRSYVLLTRKRLPHRLMLVPKQSSCPACRRKGAYICAIGPQVESREVSWTCASDEAHGPSKGMAI